MGEEKTGDPTLAMRTHRPTLHSRLFLLLLVPCFVTFSGPLLRAAQAPPKTPNDDEAFAKIQSLVTAKKYEEAERMLAAVVAQGTPAATAYFRLGKTYLDHDQWQRAADYLEKSIQAQDANDQAHLLLGLACRELRQAAKAEKEFIKAAALNPRSDVNAYFAGQQLLLDQNYEAALSYFYEAVKLNPSNALAYRALGAAQVRLGNYGLAESYYRKAVDALRGSDAADPGPYLDLAFILLLGHDPAKVEEALKLAQRAAEIQPSSPEAHYLVGKALMSQGHVKQALPELERAARLDPDDSKAHFQLARAYEELGEKEKAQAERRALAKTKQRANQQGMASGSVLPRAQP